MNKKITVRREDGTIFYCVLDGDKDLQEQFNIWYFGEAHPRNGLCVDFDGKSVDVLDYFHAEKMASFDVVAIEDTDRELLLEWTKPEEN